VRKEVRKGGRRRKGGGREGVGPKFGADSKTEGYEDER
jgi:hypothetical protein